MKMPYGLPGTSLDNSNVTTARDLTKLLNYILKEFPENLHFLSEQNVIMPNGRTERSTNIRLLSNDKINVVAGKTGFTQRAQRNVAFIAETTLNNKPYYLLIVTTGHATLDQRAATALKLAESGREALEKKLGLQNNIIQVAVNDDGMILDF